LGIGRYSVLTTPFKRVRIPSSFLNPRHPPNRLFRFLAADVLETTLHRWRMNLRTGATREDHLTDRFSEFGMIDGRHRGRPYRHVYATINEPGWFVMKGIVHHDTDSGATEEYCFPEGVYCSETAVAPRPDARHEADGYLVTITIDVVRDRSDCVVFDAARLADGPVATIRLPERVSSGTHSYRAPAPAATRSGASGYQPGNSEAVAQ